MRSLTLAVLVSIACGCCPPPKGVRVDCLYFTGGEGLNLPARVALARETMKPLVSDFCAEFDGIEIEVFSGPVTVNAAGTYYGMYVDRHITLGSDGRSLVHELFHAYDDNRGVSDQRHMLFTQKGYSALDAKYKAQVIK